MRLLQTTKLVLIEVPEESAPKYAALSHTWGEEEVSFQDIQAMTNRQWSRAVSHTVSAIKAKQGYTKLKQSAALAAEHGYAYIWIDTCCIDKTSSAELSEAINSMYRWYQNASVCYAYLADVENVRYDDTGNHFHLQCQNSRWFTRGWTLQELIAPEDVMFYSADWTFIGSKEHDQNICQSLASITGVDMRVLEGAVQPSEITVASRMKWAHKRQTTRIEDKAYCLMGLFNVNMPLLYGEGKRAFIRLQEEILRASDDHSIFAWRILEPLEATPESQADNLCGLLAESPDAFAGVESYRPLPPTISNTGSSAWSMTNQGLQISLLLQQIRDEDGSPVQDEYNALLNCMVRKRDATYRSPAIRVRRLYADQFARIWPHSIESIEMLSFSEMQNTWSYESMFVKQKPVYATPEFMVSFDNILDKSDGARPDCSLVQVWPPKSWDTETATLRPTISSQSHIVGLFRFSTKVYRTVESIDFAVGLRRKPGGVWEYWAIQRESRSTISQAARSAASFVSTSNDQTRSDSRSSLGVDWEFFPWKTPDDHPILQVEVQEVKMNDRMSYIIKASPLVTPAKFQRSLLEQLFSRA